MELSDDVSLKKLLKAKTKEKKVNFITAGECRAAEEEMERLCKIKDRLENMKQKLLEFKNDKANNSAKSSLDESVIYVPVAELREKA